MNEETAYFDIDRLQRECDEQLAEIDLLKGELELARRRISELELIVGEKRRLKNERRAWQRSAEYLEKREAEKAAREEAERIEADERRRIDSEWEKRRQIELDKRKERDEEWDFIGDRDEIS